MMVRRWVGLGGTQGKQSSLNCYVDKTLAHYVPLCPLSSYGTSEIYFIFIKFHSNALGTYMANKQKLLNIIPHFNVCNFSDAVPIKSEATEEEEFQWELSCPDNKAQTLLSSYYHY